MAYIMDMADGTEHLTEEPPYQAARETRLESRDRDHLVEHPQLQLAMVEIQTPAETGTLPAAAVEALIKTLED